MTAKKAGNVWLGGTIPKFFFPPESLDGNRIKISGDTAFHLLNVLRLKVGDKVVLCDGNNADYFTQLTEVCGKGKNAMAIFEIVSTSLCLTEPAIFLRLFQALPKGDKFELVIQKCVELGVGEIVPVFTERSNVNIRSFAKKLSRYQSIADSAAEQSERGILPRICECKTFGEVLTDEDLNLCLKCNAHNTLVAYEDEKNHSLKSTLADMNFENHRELNIWIGPEGGFADSEIATLKEAGAVTVSLGARILRTETAAIATLAQVICLLEI